MRSVPLHIIRKATQPNGRRLPAFVVLPIRGPGDPTWKFCALCAKDTTKDPKMNSKHHSKHGWVCTPCFDKHSNTNISLGDVYRAKTNIACEGNLDENEYRYWIGTRSITGQSATCRCCRDTVYSETQRSLHRGTKVVVCKLRLVHAYNFLARTKKCIVCGADNWGCAKWGVPLCSSACITKWRFDFTMYSALQDILKSQELTMPRMG